MTTAGAALPSGFHRLAWSNLAAQAAEQIALAASPIIAVLSLGAGIRETGLLQTAQTLPLLLLSIPAGVLADRTSRRRLMVWAEALRTLSLLAVVALVATDRLTWPLLAVLGLAGACGTVAYSVAAPALVPALVPPAALATANGRIELARTAAFTAGPALAGILVAWGGGTPAFGIALSLSAGAVALLAGLPEPSRRHTGAPRGMLHDLREGAAFAFGHPLLRPVFLTQAVFNAAFFVLHAVYVPYAVAHLGLSPSEVGLTLAGYGAGMATGALLAGGIIRALPFGTVIAIGPLTGLGAALVMVLTIWLPSIWLAGLAFFLIGAGPILWVISTVTLRQRVTPEPLLGRVSAIFMTAQGARPLGAAAGALVGAQYGAETCLLVAAVGFLLQAGIIMGSPVPRLDQQPPMVGASPAR